MVSPPPEFQVQRKVFESPQRSLYCWDVGGTVTGESETYRTLLWPVRAPLPAPWPAEGTDGLRSLCCGLSIYKKPNLWITTSEFRRSRNDFNSLKNAG
ncbi:hypothetical protein PoB_000174100 [Plakobranchus ocellatus]|uniref:Uncharacterized protein n=1 Tax=Plakobranchus ocellatus TaxID=259542 RepID=A0AAV3XYU0_9GAST|nr:hypothetical protein PoB_000174100 [Plakobranchus ocellatus]